MVAMVISTVGLNMTHLGNSLIIDYRGRAYSINRPCVLYNLWFNVMADMGQRTKCLGYGFYETVSIDSKLTITLKMASMVAS